MNLRDWLREGRLRQHQASPQEIRDLFAVVDRDVADAQIAALSNDRRFATAYNAVLQLATIVLRASGYRTTGVAHHWLTFQALPDVMGIAERDRADYFDSCRRKRNTADYDAAGAIGDREVSELLEEAIAFRQDVFAWLHGKCPELIEKK